jgi:hypothetical protein
VFLREAYDRGKLVEPIDISKARRKLVELMFLRHHGLGNANSNANMSSSTNAKDSDDDLHELEV